MDEVFISLQFAFVSLGSFEVNIAECSDDIEALWCFQSIDLGFVVFLEVELMVVEVVMLPVSFQSEISRVASCSEGDDLFGSIGGREESVNDMIERRSPDICASLG